MKIEIRVCAQAKRNMVKKHEGIYKVYLTAPAAEGKANKAIIPILANYFKVRKSQIEIIKGLKLRCKTISIKDI